MRLVWELDAELPRPLCNVDVFSLDGSFIGRPDLLDPVAGVVGEYDGAHHRSAEQRREDLRREEAMRHAGLEYFALVEGDLRDRHRVAERMIRVRNRALSSPRPRTWTLDRPSWANPVLTLDRRLYLRELLARLTVN